MADTWNPTIQPSTLHKLTCRICGAPPVGIYWTPGGCICAQDHIQALCAQHVVTCEPVQEMTLLFGDPGDDPMAPARAETEGRIDEHN